MTTEYQQYNFMLKYNLNLYIDKFSLKAQITVLTTTQWHYFSALILLFCLPAFPATEQALGFISTTEQPFL